MASIATTLGGGAVMNPGAWGVGGMSGGGGMPPPQPHHEHVGHQCSGGGAYDFRKSRELLNAVEEDLYACMGIDLGTKTVKVCLYIKGKKHVVLNLQPATLRIDRVVGTRSLRKWITELDRDQCAAAPPQGVHFDTGMNNATLPAPFRLLGLQNRESDLESELEKWKGVLTVAKKGEEEMDINVLIKSPEADKEEDREYVCDGVLLLSALFSCIRAQARKEAGVDCKTCCVVAPPCFNDFQRTALIRAISFAGMRPCRFVSSPLSTSIGWTDTNSGLEKGETWVCADIGASSMDVNIIKIEDGNLRTIATCGDSHCGGDDIDWAIVKIEEKIGKTEAKRLWEEPCSFFKGAILNCTRQAREKLSKSVEGTTTVELSIEDEKIEIEFSVGEVSKANQTMMDAGKLSIQQAIESVVKCSGITYGSVDRVLLSGGFTVSPTIIDKFTTAFPNAAVTRSSLTDAAKGAAVLLAETRSLLPVVLPQSVATAGSDVLALPLTLHLEPSEDASSLKKSNHALLQKRKVVETLFPAGTAIPAEVTRVVTKQPNGKPPIVYSVQQPVNVTSIGEPKLVVANMGDPLIQPDDRGFYATANQVTLAFRVDEFGSLKTPTAKDMDYPRKKHSSWAWSVLKVVGSCLIVLLVGMLGYLKLDHMANARGREEIQMKAMLHRYYSAVKPEKAADIDKMVSNYLGRQTVLHRRLKKKYGVDPRDFRK